MQQAVRAAGMLIGRRERWRLKGRVEEGLFILQKRHATVLINIKRDSFLILGCLNRCIYVYWVKVVQQRRGE